MRKILHTILTCLFAFLFLQKLSTCCSFYENKVGMFSELILWQTFTCKICLEQKKIWVACISMSFTYDLAIFILTNRAVTLAVTK